MFRRPAVPAPRQAPNSNAARPAPRLVALACGLALQGGAGSAFAQDASSSIADLPSAQVLDARTRAGFERVKLPGNERIGMIGLTELFPVGHEWWAGFGVYGASGGHRGGLFVPGVEAAWSHPFNEYVALDTGLFAGGGGGANAPVGGGLMLRPHIDLVFHLGSFYTGPTYSIVRFQNGQIDSHQFGWMININSPFTYRPADTIVAGAPTRGDATGLGFDRVDAVVTEAHPHNSIHLSTGQPLTETIGLVGMRAEHTMGQGPAWFGIEAAGAAKGGVAGYAEVLTTAGLRWPVVSDRLFVGVRGSMGLGGGGDIATGGGFLLKGAAGATLRATDTLGLGLEVGLLHAPSGHFDARTASVSLNWVLDPPAHNFSSWDAPLVAEATRMELVGGVEGYRAARKDGTTAPLQAVVLAVNRFIFTNFYVTGQAHSAYAGGAGAYSVGLFGLGTQWPVVSHVRVGAEVLAGAAGGGGVDTSGGAIAQARGYVDVALNSAISLRVGGGKIKALHTGGLDAPVVDAELVFRFGADRKLSSR
jgi:hypothetical protein